jgi:hypothetical protein
MTKAQLLASADSAELTEWQAYLGALAEEKTEQAGGGRRIKWDVDSDED